MQASNNNINTLRKHISSIVNHDRHWFRLCSYFKYRKEAKGIMLMHSPFVYDLQRHILYRKHKEDNDIKRLRRHHFNNNTTIEKDDHGIGGIKKQGHRYKIKVSKIAKGSSKSMKSATLIAELASYFKANTIVELGTSFGFTTAAIARRNPESEIITVEGAKEVLNIAVENFARLNINNITTVHSDFDTALNNNVIYDINKRRSVDMVIFDGNHQREATIRYFEHFLKHKHNDTVFIFDDIYWSREMHEAWAYIKRNEEVTLTLDIYEMGIVFFKKEIKEKRNFIIKS